MTRWFIPMAALVLVVAPPAPASAGPAHDLFGLTDVEAPILPEQVPIFARADGSRYLAVTAAKKLGCDPADTTGEGRCDWQVTAEVRGADGKTVAPVRFVLGFWKRTTDVAPVAQAIATHQLRRGEPVEMGEGSYTFSGGRKLVIEAAPGARMKLKVLAPRGEVLEERLLPPQCKGKGKKTIWGADASWFASSRTLYARPRGCAQPYAALQVVTLK
jgi:hypothetical protein